MLETVLWKTSEYEEIASPMKHQVYDLVAIASFPAGQNIIGSGSLCNINADGTYKARMVVLG